MLGFGERWVQPNNVAIRFMIDWGKDEGNPINVAIRLMIDFGGSMNLRVFGWCPNLNPNVANMFAICESCINWNLRFWFFLFVFSLEFLQMAGASVAAAKVVRLLGKQREFNHFSLLLLLGLSGAGKISRRWFVAAAAASSSSSSSSARTGFECFRYGRSNSDGRWRMQGNSWFNSSLLSSTGELIHFNSFLYVSQILGVWSRPCKWCQSCLLSSMLFKT